jgi:hypothetical protein
MVSSNMMYLIQCKNFCKCHNVPPPSITIKKKNKSKYLFNSTTAKKQNNASTFLKPPYALSEHISPLSLKGNLLILTFMIIFDFTFWHCYIPFYLRVTIYLVHN